MAKLVDSKNYKIYVGSIADCNDLKRVLEASIYDVSEEDEVKWHEQLYNVAFYGELTVVLTESDKL